MFGYSGESRSVKGWGQFSADSCSAASPAEITAPIYWLEFEINAGEAGQILPS